MVLISSLKEIRFKSIIFLKNLRYFLPPKRIKNYVRYKVPHYSRWESKKWQLFGAKNKNEYLNWSWNGCGLVCLQMIIAYKTDKKISLVDLGKKSLILEILINPLPVCFTNLSLNLLKRNTVLGEKLSPLWF